jgi:threonine/homoserine/homoserine lactone efflux protein
MPRHGLAPDLFRAAATCLMNPKAYAFTLAILPSFITHRARRWRRRRCGWAGIIALNQGLVYGAVA